MMVRIFYLTGMRPMSLEGITLDDLAENGIWITKKGGKRILQAIDPENMELVLEYVEKVLPHVVLKSRTNDGLFLFPSFRGRKMDNNSITLVFKRQLGTKLTPYSLRHGVAQGMWSQGASSNDVIEVLGHDGVRSIKNYVTEHDLNRAKAVLESFHPLFQRY